MGAFILFAIFGQAKGLMTLSTDGSESNAGIFPVFILQHMRNKNTLIKLFLKLDCFCPNLFKEIMVLAEIQNKK